ncbi:hypothetical protein [Nocardia nova]
MNTTIDLVSLVLATTALTVSTVVVSRSRTDAKNCARDARTAAKYARRAAESIAKVDPLTGRIHIEPTQIPPGALAPTIELDPRRLAREMHRAAEQSCEA